MGRLTTFVARGSALRKGGKTFEAIFGLQRRLVVPALQFQRLVERQGESLVDSMLGRRDRERPIRGDRRCDLEARVDQPARGGNPVDQAKPQSLGRAYLAAGENQILCATGSDQS